MATVVRPARASDRIFIDRLGESSAAASFSILRPAASGVPAESFRRLAAFCFEQPGTVTLVAEHEGRQAGFLILLTSVPDEVTRREQAFVAYMAVEEGARRHGVGRELLRAAENEARARALPHLSLMVTASNHRARTLYGGAGFVEERVQMTKPMQEGTG